MLYAYASGCNNPTVIRITSSWLVKNFGAIFFF
jgi:hypothetical protein